MNRLASIVLPLSLAALVSGCFTTTLHSGRPAEAKPAVVLDGVEAAEFDERWHHGFVNGVAEVNGNYNLRYICPNGWSEITTEESFLNGLVTVATGFVYTPQSVSIRCATDPGGSSGPAASYPAGTATPSTPPAAALTTPEAAEPPLETLF